MGESSKTQTIVNESEDGDDGFEHFFARRPQQQRTPTHQQPRSPRVQPQQQVDHLRSLGLRTDISEFKGRLQPDDFLDWLQTVERVFDLRDIPGHLKKQDAYLDYHNLQLGSLPVEEIIREFERMRMRCGQTKMKNKLALRVEQQLNNKLKPLTKFPTTFRPPTSAPRFGPINTEPPVILTTQTGTSNALRCFKCQGLGHLKRDCPNKQILYFVDEPEPTYDTEDEEEPTEVLYPDRANTMAEKLSLPTQKHLDPYKLTWMKKGNLVQVIPMDACHILLGRPWLYDRRVKHDGFHNMYSFKKDGLSITLAPLNPRDEPQQPLTKPNFVGLTKQPTTTHVLALVVVEANPEPLECLAAVLLLLREFAYNRSTHSSFSGGLWAQSVYTR
nr:reverse transcriptase domain-containing protein [Tanacetum cinerariifolium]